MAPDLEAEEKAEDGEKEDDADAEEQLPAEVLPDVQAGLRGRGLGERFALQQDCGTEARE